MIEMADGLFDIVYLASLAVEGREVLRAVLLEGEAPSTLFTLMFNPNVSASLAN